MIYQFKTGYRFGGIDPQGVGETLEGIRKKHGRLETEVVVKEAKKKRSPMHGAFDWDDASAAHQYRLETARRLIRSLVVVLEDQDEPAYVHIKLDDADNYYQSTEVACKNVEEWQIVRDQALRFLKNASDKLDTLDAVARRVLGHQRKAAISNIKKTVDNAVSELTSIT